MEGVFEDGCKGCIVKAVVCTKHQSQRNGNLHAIQIKKEINYVELPTEFRFIIYGLSVADAFQAARDWTLINKCRHLSGENEFKLKGALKDRGQTRKEFLKTTLAFYRKVKLFNKD